MVRLRMTQEQLQELRDHLASAAPEEDGAFLTVGACPSPRGPFDLTARRLVLPRPEDWEFKGGDYLKPTTDYINRAVMAADAAGCGLAFIHSHPRPGHPRGLSAVDQTSTRKLFANFATLLPKAPLASLVFTPSTADGVIKHNGRLHKLDGITTIGTRLRHVSADALDQDESAPANNDASASRQILAFGQDGQDRIAAARIAVVGAGGTGSAVLEQLARLGARNLWVVDDDKLEASNISRVYGSRARDAADQSSKVESARRSIKAISPNAKVTTLDKALPDDGTMRILATMDIIFGCTDTHGSRAALNDLAYQCHVPVIDIGCLMHATNGHLQASLARVRLLQTGLPCLWCTDTIDGRRILQERMSPEERRKLVAEGYGLGMGPQPSVIHLTTLAASLAINEFLRLVAYAGAPSDGKELYVNLDEGTIMHVRSTTNVTCRCIKQSGRGMT